MTKYIKPRKLAGYDLGKSAIFASKSDQRFSYCTYIPSSYKPGQKNDYKLLVLIHSSDRSNQDLRDYFIDFAEQNNFILLSPLFPCGIEEENDYDNYKYVKYKDNRFDLILLSMISQVSTKYNLSWKKFNMYGFSGGAHFAHRFLLLHPEKIDTLCIASPGSITQINSEKNWWVGTKNIKDIFGIEINLKKLARPKIHLCVGEKDTSTVAITHSQGKKHWMEGANSAGATRIDRLKSLYKNYTDHNMNVTLEIIPNKSHDTNAMNECAKIFFLRNL